MGKMLLCVLINVMIMPVVIFAGLPPAVDWALIGIQLLTIMYQLTVKL